MTHVFNLKLFLINFGNLSCNCLKDMPTCSGLRTLPFFYYSDRKDNVRTVGKEHEWTVKRKGQMKQTGHLNPTRGSNYFQVSPVCKCYNVRNMAEAKQINENG